MIRRTASHLVRWIAGFAAGLALFAVFVGWRLSMGPITLDYLAPYVAAAMAGPDSGIVVRIDHTLVRLGEDQTLEVVARGVHLAQRDSEAQLTLPELSVGLSLRAALGGVAAPTRIILQAPQLRLERAENGTFRLGLDTATPTADGWGANLLRDLAAPPNHRGSLGYLTEVAVRDAALTVDDRALGVKWQAKRADATLFRGADGVSGDIALVVEMPGGVESELHGDFRYATGDDHLAMQLAFADLRPALFADAAPGLAPLSPLQLPFSGQIRIELDPTALHIIYARCDITLGAGPIVHPALEGGSLAVESGQLRAAYDTAAGRITIERLRLDLGGPQVDATGMIDGVGERILAGSLPQAIDITAELHVADVAANDLPNFWPDGLAAHSRLWIVEHIHDGIAGGVIHVAAHMDLSPGAVKPVRLDTFNGTLDYRGLTVDYFKPLAPLRGVDGTATFDRTRLDLVPVTGVVNGVKFTTGTAKLSKLDTNDEEIAIEFGLRGPLHDVLEVLDSKPLQYAHALKIDPARVGGQVDGQVTFAFPLVHDLKLNQVDYGARAALSGVAIGQVLFGQDLSAGELQLRLDRVALRLDGTAVLGETPVALNWVQSLKANDATRTRYAVRARLDDAARRRLDFFDFLSDVAKGPIDVDVAYTVFSAKRGAATVLLDLRDTTLDVGQINWHKPSGIPATAALDLDLVDDHLSAIRQATIKGGGMDAKLAVAFGNPGDGAVGITRAEVSRLITGSTDVTGAVTPRSEGGWRVELRGLSLDATGLVADIDRSPSNEQMPPLVIDATLDRLILGPKREARNVTAQLYSNGLHWQAVSVDATMFGNGKASLRFGHAAGDRAFRLSTDDFGALMRLADITDNVAGGQLVVTGQVEDNGPRRLFRGKVEGADYRVVGAPILARLLSIASFSGIGALLSGEGIPFTRLKADFVLADGKLNVQDWRAYGGAMGINADGVYDIDAKALDFEGTIVPAYTLNSVLGNIPVFGKLLLGGEGEGIFGANFRVAGPVSDAKITVNPLSALAPGVLRKLFLFGVPDPGLPSADSKRGEQSQ